MGHIKESSNEKAYKRGIQTRSDNKTVSHRRRVGRIMARNIYAPTSPNSNAQTTSNAMTQTVCS